MHVYVCARAFTAHVMEWECDVMNETSASGWCNSKEASNKKKCESSVRCLNLYDKFAFFSKLCVFSYRLLCVCAVLKKKKLFVVLYGAFYCVILFIDLDTEMIPVSLRITSNFGSAA